MTGRKPVFEQFAPAKINLYLNVGPPHADGFHPLDSLAAFASIGDWVRVAPAAGLTLQVTGPFAGALAQEPDNLVLRAARALAAAFEIDPSRGAAITLEKNLPIASGIGGGSSDAAAALRALSRLWNIPPDADLTPIAQALGSDVPACIKGQSVIMRGRGERLTPVDTPSIGIVLANDGSPISTPDVYRRFDASGLGGEFSEKPAPMMSNAESYITALARYQNDLEAPAFQLAPAIVALKEWMSGLPGCGLARMSGSGGTVFGLFAGAAAAHSARDLLQRRHPDLWTAAGVLGELKKK